MQVSVPPSSARLNGPTPLPIAPPLRVLVGWTGVAPALHHIGAGHSDLAALTWLAARPPRAFISRSSMVRFASTTPIFATGQHYRHPRSYHRSPAGRNCRTCTYQALRHLHPCPACAMPPRCGTGFLLPSSCVRIVRASPISLFAVEAAGTAIIHTEDASSPD
jgi:hypothetical protein